MLYVYEEHKKTENVHIREPGNTELLPFLHQRIRNVADEFSVDLLEQCGFN